MRLPALSKGSGARLAVVFLIGGIISGCSGGGMQAERALTKAPVSAPAPQMTDPPPQASTSPGKGREGQRRASTQPGSSSGKIERRVFSPDEDRIGLTDAAIRLCVHVPRAYLPLVGIADTEDLSVHWRMVNDQGGIAGRQVVVMYEDDQNTIQGTEIAMERCRERGAFAIISGTLALENILAGRSWAERNRSLYLFNLSNEEPRRDHSFSPFISLDDAAILGARWVLSRYKGSAVGLVRRTDPPYDAAANAFEDRLTRSGRRLSVAVGTYANQTNYRDEIAALKSRAEVVLVLDDPLASTEMIKQARQQGYSPQWILLSALNMTTDLLGSDALGPPAIEALSVWPPYSPGRYDGVYERYGAEVRAFEEAFIKYRGRPPSSDVAWIFWAYWRVAAEQFHRCGRDCTRTTFVSIADWQAGPFCPIRFHPGSNFGGQTISIVRAFSAGPGRSAWGEVEGAVCRSDL